MRLAPGYMLLGFALLGAGLPTSAWAQRASPQEEAACRRDVNRFCRGMSRDPTVMLACLQSNRARLSKRCQIVLRNHGV